MSTGAEFPPIHPGEVLVEEYLSPLALSPHRLAMAIGVPQRRINKIVHGKRRISADTGLRLSRYFGTSERFWMNLQGRYDLELERDRLSQVLEEISPLVRTRLFHESPETRHRAGRRSNQAEPLTPVLTPAGAHVGGPWRTPGRLAPRN